MGSAAERLAEWERRYRAGTTAWERGEANPAFLAWLESGALTPGRVLVPGAGRSPEPRLLAERGFCVMAVDIAPTPARAAAEQLPEAGISLEWVQADLLRFEASEPYDAVYEQTCLCALHPDHWEA